MDLIVDGSVVVEAKCVEGINPVQQAQVLSQIRLSGRQIGLLINFHVPHLRDGIQRMVDGQARQKQFPSVNLCVLCG
jgi:GxxExxY protein